MGFEAFFARTLRFLILFRVLAGPPNPDLGENLLPPIILIKVFTENVLRTFYRKFSMENLQALVETFVLDSAMAMIMSEADWCLTGADSIGITGSVANKIGTYQLALLAQKHAKPLYIATEIMKLQTNTIEGHPILLEQRPPNEILDNISEFEGSDLIKVVHQFFDLTPASYVRGLITEQGIISPATIGTAWNKFVSMFDSVS